MHCVDTYTGAAYIPPDVAELSAGDAVKVELDPDLFKIAQEEHGGWSDLMAEVLTIKLNYYEQGGSLCSLPSAPNSAIFHHIATCIHVLV